MKSMNVYKSQMTGSYCGGLLIIAANNQKEAEEVVEKYGGYYYGKPELVPSLSALPGTPRVIAEGGYAE
jgi:hypothetical protein